MKEINDNSTLNSINNEPIDKLINKSTNNESISEQLNNDNQINSNDNQQSKIKSIDNLFCKDKWIFKYDWNFRDELIKLLGEYTKLLITNKEILSCNRESIKKNKNDLNKLLNKSPLELDEESKFYEICFNFDCNFKDQIINQLIKNENVIIYCKNKIDKNLKNKLIEENNQLINKLINLPAQSLNNDIILIEDEELKFSQSKFKDEKLKNKSKTEFSNLQNDKFDLKEEKNKLKRKLDISEIINNKKIKYQLNQNNSIERYCVKKDMKNKEITSDDGHHLNSDNSFGNQLNEPHNKETQSNEEYNLSNIEQTDDARLPLNIENNSLDQDSDIFRENTSLDQIEAELDDKENRNNCININITNQMADEAISKLTANNMYKFKSIKKKPQLLYLSIYLNQFYRSVIKKEGNIIMSPIFQKKIACEDLRKQLPTQINHLPINFTPIEVGRVVCFTFPGVIRKLVAIGRGQKNFYIHLCRVDDLDDVNNTVNSADDTQPTGIITPDDDHHLSSDNSFGNQLNESHNKEVNCEEDNLSNNNEQTGDARLPLNIENNSLDDDSDTFRENTLLDQIESEQLHDKENRDNCIKLNITNRMIKKAKGKLIGTNKFSSDEIKWTPQLLYLSIYLNQFYRTIIKKKDNKIMLPRYQKKIASEDLRKQLPKKINHLSTNLTPTEVGRVVCFTFKDVIRKQIGIDNERRNFYLYLCKVDDLDNVYNRDNSADDTQSTEIITHDDDHHLSSNNSFGNQLNEPHNKEAQSNEEYNLINNNEQTDDARLPLNIENNSLDDEFDTFRENASLDQIEAEKLDDKKNRDCININITNQMIEEAKRKLIGIDKFNSKNIEKKPQLLYLSIYLNQFYRSVIKYKVNKIMASNHQKRIKCDDLRKQLPKKINHLSINLTPQEVGKVVRFTFKDVIRRKIKTDEGVKHFYTHLCRVDDLDDVNNTDNSADDVQIMEIN